MGNTKHRARVVLDCGGHEHEICYPISREVHPDLRCTPDQGAGYGSGSGSGGGCSLPSDLEARVERELRGGGLQEARRRGFVRIAA